MKQVDILLATYNGAKYIKPLLDSILSQTYSDFSVIISDDCSTDATVKIINEYTKKDDRIVFYKQEKNLGFVKNFEFLLNQSTSQYIAFADQDDVWSSNKIEKMLSIIKTTGKSLVYSDMRRIDSDGNVIFDSWLKSKSYPRVCGTNSKACAVRHFAAGCSQMFTASVKQKMLPFKESVFAHDWVSVFCASELMGILFIRDSLVDYRAHSENVYGGAEDFADNLIKRSNGDTSYKAFCDYRKAVIYQNHLRGLEMCTSYASLGATLKEISDYLNDCSESTVFPPLLHNYFRYMKPSGCGRRMFYEIMYLHFPLIHYIVYRRTIKRRLSK